MPLLSRSHPQISTSTHAASSPLNVTAREHFPSNQMQEPWRELKGMVMSHIPKKEGKGRGREREEGKEFKFRYLLTETQKRTHIQAPRWQKSQRSGLWSFASSMDLPEAPQEPSPPLTRTQKRTEERSALPAQVYLRFNESVTH